MCSTHIHNIVDTNLVISLPIKLPTYLIIVILTIKFADTLDVRVPQSNLQLSHPDCSRWNCDGPQHSKVQGSFLLLSTPYSGWQNLFEKHDSQYTKLPFLLTIHHLSHEMLLYRMIVARVRTRVRIARRVQRVDGRTTKYFS